MNMDDEGPIMGFFEEGSKALGESQGFCSSWIILNLILSRRDKMLGVGQYFTFNDARQPAIRT